MTELQLMELDTLLKVYTHLKTEPHRNTVGYNMTLASSSNTADIKDELKFKEESLLITILSKMETLILSDVEIIEADKSALINIEDMKLMLQLDPNCKAVHMSWSEDLYIYYKDGKYYTEESEEYDLFDEYSSNNDEWLIFT